jgi:crotonobetainyl-CoA:carnitine CoA-transferase CaiB-like acyl-CoA transferase
MAGPLEGIKVLDLSRVLAGPWASQLLGDYGADVVKVERPGLGDETRAWGPPWLGGEEGESAYFLSTNRIKRSLTLDLGHPDGQQLASALANRADVLIENFRVGTMARFGLAPATLIGANPRLVVCSISAYGQDGSRSGEPGYDAMIQASGGLMSITGPPESDGGTPQKVGVAIADIMAGMYAVTAILAALEERHASGRGQLIDIPMYDSQVAWLANQAMNYLIGGQTPRRRGTAHPNLVPYQTFASSDGYFTLAVGNDTQFQACTACLGRPELGSDRRFASNAARVEHRDDLIAILAAVFRAQPTAHWLAIMKEAGVPVGPINTVADVLSDDYARERGLVRSVAHRLDDDLPTVANPVRFSRTPVWYGAAPPVLGQHTEEVLSEWLGYTRVQVEALANAGAV